jgi:hypothetical protein
MGTFVHLVSLRNDRALKFVLRHCMELEKLQQFNNDTFSFVSKFRVRVLESRKGVTVHSNVSTHPQPNHSFLLPS